MDFFNYKNNEPLCETAPAARIAAEVGTPVYVYSKATLLHHYRQVEGAFKQLNPIICYSIKSCSNLHVCKLLIDAGCGMDVTSGGELFRALKAGCDPKKIIYAGVGKTDDEIRMAIDAGIAAFNIESEAEIENIDRIAGEMGKTAIGALRINPDVDPGHKTHAKTTTGKKEHKFGVDIERAERVFDQYKSLKNLRIGGLHLHIGSPIYDIASPPSATPPSPSRRAQTPPTKKNAPPARDEDLAPADGETVDIVGPICESGDYLAKGRALPQTKRGDLLAVFTAGAYGFAMSSNYNNRPRAAEVLVDGDKFTVIRRRETYEDLIAPEII